MAGVFFACMIGQHFPASTVIYANIVFMREFFVNLGVDRSHFTRLYEQLSTSYKTGVTLDADSIVLENETAKGKIDFISITPHLSLLKLNIQFGEDVDIRRVATKTPSFYSCLFSLKETVDLHAFSNVDEQEMNRIGFSAKHSALYFSADVQALFRVIPNEVSKVIIIIFTVNALKELLQDKDDQLISLFSGETVKGYAAMNPLMIDEVSMLFDLAISEGAQELFFWGSALKLIASLTHQVYLEGEKLKQETGILEAARMIQVRNLLVSDLSGNCPAISAMAEKAHMSLTKFKSLFKQMFHLSYYQYYQHYRLIAAKESLVFGKSPTETAYEYGFSNLGHFSSAFKKKFKVSPTEL
jgi:AraC-like DNA-binding protein